MDSRAISRRDLEELEEILRGGTAVREFLSGLFEVSLTMGAVTALLLILSPVWKRRFRPQWRCWAWLLVALRLAVPFNVSLPRAPVVLEAPAPAAVSAAWVEEEGFQGVELTARTLPPGGRPGGRGAGVVPHHGGAGLRRLGRRSGRSAGGAAAPVRRLPPENGPVVHPGGGV